MKNFIKAQIIGASIGALIGLAIYLVFKTHSAIVTGKMEIRANELGLKKCYTGQDIEYIIFGEAQE